MFTSLVKPTLLSSQKTNRTNGPYHQQLIAMNRLTAIQITLSIPCIHFGIASSIFSGSHQQTIMNCPCYLPTVGPVQSDKTKKSPQHR